MSTYLWINLGALIIPLAFSFSKHFPFYREWKYFFPAVILMAVPFLIWDALFTKIGVWGFNPMHLQGWQLAGLPLEEYLFFFCIPYACVFTYFVLKKYIPVLPIPAHKTLSGLAAILLVIALIHYDLRYTFWTFFSLAVVLVFIVQKRPTYLGHFLLMYLVTLIPFFIVNGLLTGSWIPEEVVWYNDVENLGIRIGTIPIEDTMYGMLMLLLTVTFMEWLRARQRRCRSRSLKTETR